MFQIKIWGKSNIHAKRDCVLRAKTSISGNVFFYFLFFFQLILQFNAIVYCHM